MGDIKYEWEITFAHGIKNKTFTRWAKNELEAVDDARDGFQSVYGYWPGAVIKAINTGRTTNDLKD